MKNYMIDAADYQDMKIWKYADPTEGARLVSADEAKEICQEDPSLLAVVSATALWYVESLAGEPFGIYPGIDADGAIEALNAEASGESSVNDWYMEEVPTVTL